ncbi:MAG TPA: diphthine--ammonia ligase [Thermoplasmata archaeon]|nr:diphthine--ammonia ligase [Thermoplasmata archaeon]
MTVTALVSGGKDSIYSAYLAETQGWPVDELVTIVPEDPDAMMFHTPNLDLVALQARAWKKAHRRVPVHGSGEGPELAALKGAIDGDHGPVVAGAIQSSYQWARLLRIAGEVGRRVYVPLWRKDPVRVVREEIAAGLDIRLVHLAAEPLTAELLGRRLDLALMDELERRSREIRTVNVAGEGGEFETLVVDAPFFEQRIEMQRVERTVTGSTADLVVEKARLVPKDGRPPSGGGG